MKLIRLLLALICSLEVALAREVQQETPSSSSFDKACAQFISEKPLSNEAMINQTFPYFLKDKKKDVTFLFNHQKSWLRNSKISSIELRLVENKSPKNSRVIGKLNDLGKDGDWQSNDGIWSLRAKSAKIVQGWTFAYHITTSTMIQNSKDFCAPIFYPRIANTEIASPYLYSAEKEIYVIADNVIIRRISLFPILSKEEKWEQMPDDIGQSRLGFYSNKGFYVFDKDGLKTKVLPKAGREFEWKEVSSANLPVLVREIEISDCGGVCDSGNEACWLNAFDRTGTKIFEKHFLNCGLTSSSGLSNDGNILVVSMDSRRIFYEFHLKSKTAFKGSFTPSKDSSGVCFAISGEKDVELQHLPLDKKGISCKLRKTKISYSDGV